VSAPDNFFFGGNEAGVPYTLAAYSIPCQTVDYTGNGGSFPQNRNLPINRYGDVFVSFPKTDLSASNSEWFFDNNSTQFAGWDNNGFYQSISQTIPPLYYYPEQPDGLSSSGWGFNAGYCDNWMGDCNFNGQSSG
jgi:hypothetical protein